MKKPTAANPFKRLLVIPVLLLAVAVACDFSGASPTETPAPTDTKQPTATSTNTPEPTATPDLVATQSAEATEMAEEVIANIEETVEDYEIPADLEKGHLEWVQDDSVNITLTQFGTKNFELIANDVDYADFVLRSNVTWNSTGIGLCGFIFRSEKDLDKGEQFQFAAVRFSGLPVYWLEYHDMGKWVFSLGGRGRTNDAIDVGENATNEFILYAQGDTLSVYANGTRLTNASISKLSEGRLAFYSFQQEGQTECEFADTWLYVLDPETEE